MRRDGSKEWTPADGDRTRKLVLDNYFYSDGYRAETIVSAVNRKLIVSGYLSW
jgi:hypothetical protein